MTCPSGARFMAVPVCRWSEPPASLASFRDEVHLWYSSLDPPTPILRRLEGTLNVDERERVGRFWFEEERTRFVAGRGLLRAILGLYLGIKPSEVHFNYGPYGKPSLVGEFGLGKIEFNLAHSNGYAIYAFALNRKVGVDLEQVAPTVEAEQFANRFFSDQEKGVIHTLEGKEKLEAFFKIWTAKEAYLKASGEGLAYPLDKVDVSLDPGESPRLSEIRGNVQEDSRLFVEHLRPASDFMAALVVQGPKCGLDCWRWPDFN